jgi:hypothetical protein
MLHHLTPDLKTHGFVKHGDTFSKRIEGNVAVIEFQRSPDSTPSEYVFFVNLQTTSRLVYWFERGQSKLPDVPKDDHWWVRLGELLPKKASWGWKIENQEEASWMAEGILDALREYGLPLLETHAHDQDLLEGWTRGLASRRGGDIRPLVRLSILAAAYGRHSLVESAIAKLREECAGQPCSSVVEAHAEKLAQWHW